MADQISYPIDDMSAVAKKLRTFLQEQLALHNTVFHNQQHSYSALTLGLAQNIPEAGGLASAFVNEIGGVHTNIVDCYSELLAILDQLENGGQVMGQMDNQVAKGFQRDG